MMTELPIFEHVTRRTLLRRGALALAGGALLAACGNDDESALSPSPTASATTRPTTATSGASVTTVTAATNTTTATSDTATATSDTATATPDTSDTTTAAGSNTSSASSDAHPATVTFTYAPSDSSGRVRNPYIAAWIEDEGSTMVGLVSVWYEARESKYLRELTEFTGVSAVVAPDAIDAVSGATRTPGDYSLQWDGTGLDGSALSGSYTLWVEAAREHGPHSVTSGPITLGESGTATVAGNGELSDVTVAIA